MDKHKEVFDFIKDALIEWKPKNTNLTIAGTGFNEWNIREFANTLPTTHEFDYVYVSPPIINESGITTGARGVQRSTQTFTIEVYCLREGAAGAAQKRATLWGLHETTQFIRDLLARHGFIISMPRADFSEGNHGRQTINATITFIK